MKCQGKKHKIHYAKLAKKLTPEHIIATADVKSLYTNVPIKHGISVVSKFVKKHSSKIDMLGLEFSDFVLMLTEVVEAGYFRFDDSYYRQIDGLGMGVKPAPPFAIIYVYCTVEKPLLEDDYEYALTTPQRPADLMNIDSWDRYVDDCLLIGKGTQEDVDQLFTYVNKLNPHIQFTYEVSREKVDYLDLTLHLDPQTCSVEYELFIKPTSLGIFLNYNSSHPHNIILNTALNEMLRALKNGSTTEYKENGKLKIAEMLRKNDFPEATITDLTSKARSKISMPLSPSTPKDKDKLYYLTLPYINEPHKRKVHQILRKNGLLEHTRLSFTHDPNLKEILTRSALRNTPCNKQNDSKCYSCDDQCMVKNLTYQLTCSLCPNAHYVGETGRFKRNRCWEHYKSVMDKSDSTAMGKHYLACHSDVPIPTQPFEFKILQTCKDFPERMIAQSTFIKQISPTINTQLSDDTDCWNKCTWGIM